MALRLDEIVRQLGGTLEGDPSVAICQVASLESARDGQIAFLSTAKFLPLLKTTRASAVILAPRFADESRLPRVVHPNPYAYYARVAALFNPLSHGFSGVDPSAAVQSEIPSSSRVGARAVIGKRVGLGRNVTIYPGCVIGDDVFIDDDAVLYPNVVVCHHCRIGKRTVIQAGAVIGGDGFGFAQEGASWVKIPQIGRVIIGDDVEIGVNTAIDRGALDDTVIGNGVKIDNLIQIAHNVRVGDDTAMAGCVGIAGSTRIGKRCTIGGAGMISGHLDIADDVHVSAGTLVAKSLKKPGVYTGVYPMETHEEWLRNAARIRQLALLGKRVAELEKELGKHPHSLEETS